MFKRRVCESWEWNDGIMSAWNYECMELWVHGIMSAWNYEKVREREREPGFLLWHDNNLHSLNLNGNCKCVGTIVVTIKCALYILITIIRIIALCVCVCVLHDKIHWHLTDTCKWVKGRQVEYRCVCLFSLSVQVVHFVFKEHDLWKMQPKITKSILLKACMYMY